MQEKDNLNSVDQPTTGSTKTKDNGHIPDATNEDQQKAVFMRAKTHSRIYRLVAACQK